MFWGYPAQEMSIQRSQQIRAIIFEQTKKFTIKSIMNISKQPRTAVVDTLTVLINAQKVHKHLLNGRLYYEVIN